MQERPVEPVDLVVDPAQRGISLRILVPPQDAAGEKGDKRQRNHQRGDHGRNDRNEEGPGVGSGATGKEQQGHEGKYQHERRADDRRPNLQCRIDRRLGPRLAHSQMPRDILRHHDTVVDQQAQSNNEAGNRQLAEVEAGGIKHQQTGRERERDRDHHDGR